MIVGVQAKEKLSREQIRAFLAASQEVQSDGRNREEVYGAPLASGGRRGGAAVPSTCESTRCTKAMGTEPRGVYHTNAVDEVTQMLRRLPRIAGYLKPELPIGELDPQARA